MEDLNIEGEDGVPPTDAALEQELMALMQEGAAPTRQKARGGCDLYGELVRYY